MSTDPRDPTLPMDVRLAAALHALTLAAATADYRPRAAAEYIRAVGVTMADPPACHMDPFRCALAAYLALVLGHPTVVAGPTARVLDLPPGANPEAQTFEPPVLAECRLPHAAVDLVAYFDDGQFDDVFAGPVTP